MTPERFVFKIKRDSIPEPRDFSLRRFSCFDFFNSIHKFIDHNFRGAIRISFPDSYKGFVHISPRGFAYFLSALLSEIYGNSMVEADVAASESYVVITIKGIGTPNRKNQLFDIAERSGFSVSEEHGALILKTSVFMTQEIFVYANDMLELVNYFYEVFLAQNE